MEKKYKFRKNVDIGSLEAENDTFLNDAFVQKDELEILLDVKNPRNILIGRTGSGKSALLRYIEENNTKVCRIQPEEMALTYLNNSDILNYFLNLGVNLEIFYKLLWKHVLLIEMLNMYFGKNYLKERNFFDRLKDKYLLNQKKKNALNYLEKYENEFWEKTETRIKIIEEQLTTKFRNELGGNAHLFDYFIQHKTLSEENKGEKIIKEVLHKAQTVVGSIQLEEIYGIIDLLKEDLFVNHSNKYFIIIDDLDKDWVDKKLVYELIRSLIITTNDLKKIPCVKVIIALRDNIYDILFSNPTRTVQREKYTNYNVEIAWSKPELKDLINSRLSVLMKDAYTNESPTVDDITPYGSKEKLSGFDFMVTRTLLRPRDIISFFNKCIQKASGTVKISRDNINDAEKEYSVDRLRALDDEWFDNYGQLKLIYCFLHGKTESFVLSDIQQNDFIDFAIHGSRESLSEYTFKIYEQYFRDHNIDKLLRELLSILYRVGMVGVKLSPVHKKAFSIDSAKSIDPLEITETTKFYVHPAFHTALKIVIKH